MARVLEVRPLHMRRVVREWAQRCRSHASHVLPPTTAVAHAPSCCIMFASRPIAHNPSLSLRVTLETRVGLHRPRCLEEFPKVCQCSRNMCGSDGLAMGAPMLVRGRALVCVCPPMPSLLTTLVATAGPSCRCAVH